MRLTFSLNYVTNRLVIHEDVRFGKRVEFCSVLGDADDAETMTRCGVALYRLYAQIAEEAGQVFADCAPLPLPLLCPVCGSADCDSDICTDIAFADELDNPPPPSLWSTRGCGMQDSDVDPSMQGDYDEEGWPE